MTDLETLRAIEQVYVRYCELIDGKAFDQLSDVFTQDLVHDFTQAYGPGLILKGLPAVLARLHHRMGAGSNCGTTHHNVGNFRIEVNGDTAKARVNYHAVHRGVREHDGAFYSMWGIYNDDLVRTPGGWRVAYRRYSISLRDGPVVTSAPGD